MSLYGFAKAIAGTIFKLGGARIIGKENIPDEKAVLLIANHISFADPPALSYAYPRQITYIAKEGFAKKAFTRVLFGALGAVFLKAGESDLPAIRYAINELKQGRAVAIFPEGQRNRDQVIGEFKGGAAYIAYRTGATVLPMSVINTRDYLRIWRRNIIINIGKPIKIAKKEHLSKDELEKYNLLFCQKIKKLFEQSKEILISEEKLT